MTIAKKPAAEKASKPRAPKPSKHDHERLYDHIRQVPEHVHDGKEPNPAEHVHGEHCNHDHSGHHAEQAQDHALPHPKTVVHGMPKIGRNDPCPCGSGKKYKKCCLV